MLRIRQIKIPVENSNDEVLLSKIAKTLHIKTSDITSFSIKKKSLDARKKDAIYYIYEVDVKTPKEALILKSNTSNDIFASPNEEYICPPTGSEELKNRPIIVGSGPAGLFCAYLLAEQGYKPLIIERGEDVDSRVKTIEEFWATGKLNKDTNVQFGEGGAGTFSDGKLNTMSKDKAFRGKRIFEIFVENGAPEEIMYISNPHIGTDLLRKVIKNIRNKIIENGGNILYNTMLTNLIIENSTVTKIEVNNKEQLPCSVLVLAIGHSARETFHLLHKKNLSMAPKPFAVGVRIEHPQKMINESQYGKYAHLLPPANYKLTYTTKENRGVYSFCMCPGGFVVNASSQEGHLAINGMSNYNRSEENANSALVVTVNPKDYGSDLFAGLTFQEELEESAYKLGNGKVPIQLYKDFKEDNESTTFLDIKPVHKGAYTFANLNECLPESIASSIKEAIPEFAKKITGYDAPGAIISAIESRTSSPIRIERDENYTSNIAGIYPCGEGSGYAGGITTAAMDGFKVAEAIIKKYHN